MKIFGREKIIEAIWQTLNEKSVLLTAERRMGKTEVLKSMRNNPNDGFIVIFSDLEKISTPLDFVNDVIKSIEELASNEQRFKNTLQMVRDKLSGTEIAGMIKIPESETQNWKANLTKIITDVCENNSDHKVVFLWDEVPYMLQKINKMNEDGTLLSLEILDVLRSLRNETDNLRMVYTGSVGIHHVINDIKNNNIATQPINDLEPIILPKLKIEDAKAHAEYRLTQVEQIMVNVDDEILHTLVTEADCIPFYVERVIKALMRYDDEITPDGIAERVNHILVGGEDTWELEHFRTRLAEYYQHDITIENKHIPSHIIAKEILNLVAISDEPLPYKQIINQLKHLFPLDEVLQKNDIMDLLKLLVKDHYLLKTQSKGYSFNFSIVQRWWIEAEELV